MLFWNFERSRSGMKKNSIVVLRVTLELSLSHWFGDISG